MKVSEVMSRNVQLAAPDQSIRKAAQLMQQHDIGSLPVGENERLVGIVTDRDIVVRAIAQGRDPDTPIREVMTDDIQYCSEEDDVDEVSRRMAQLEIRRLPVLDSDQRVIGMMSLANVAHSQDDAAERAVKGVATPH